MKVRGLRIGNYISGIYINGDCSEYDSYEEKEELCEVVGIDSVGFSESNIWVAGLEKSGIENYDSFEPIPLTEQWLIDFGFEKNSITQGKFNKKEWQIFLQPDGNHIFRIVGMSLCNCKYVHELQNLFFALTGKELEVKTEINKYY